MKALNKDNYGPYLELVMNNYQTIHTVDINKENLNYHFNSILNIMRDTVEQIEFKQSFIHVIFVDEKDCELSIPDYFYNLIMWTLPLEIDQPVSSYYLFYQENITKRYIKQYIDSKFIEDNRNKIPNIVMNNIIHDCVSKFKVIDEFSMYLSNTVNLEDTIKLMNENKEVNDIIHLDVSNVPLEQIKNKGMEATDRLNHIIMHSDHCLRDFYRAGEGINKKQFKEVSVNEGTKTNGRGQAFPVAINNNLLTGGANSPLTWYIEENTGRASQLIIYNNVGTSGAFARLLGLNNTDTFFHDDPDYICDTHNFIEIVMESEEMLRKFQTGRYFRLSPNGIEYEITKKGIIEADSGSDRIISSKTIIGKKIYLRSPMTCASLARGEGLCYRCYGDLAHTNEDINPGKIAAEIISSILTQMQLSAKHLLESNIKIIKWSEDFNKCFALNSNIIQISDNVPIEQLKNYKIILNRDSINLEDGFDIESAINSDYIEYVTQFKIQYPDGHIGNIYNISDDDDDEKNMYLTPELNDYIRENAQKFDEEENMYITFEDLKDTNLFSIEISNIELSDTLYKIKKIINNKDKTKQFNKDQWVLELLRTMKDKIGVSSIHIEMILANQLRSPENIFSKPQWEYPNEPYTVMTLNEALSKNPSVTISMSYQAISRVLYSPLTFKKNGSSFMDLFFMTQPQNYISNKHIDKKPKIEKNSDGSVNMFSYIKKEE